LTEVTAATSEEAYVRKFAFRKFEGLRKGRLYRVWSVASFNMVHQWSRSRAMKILIGFIAFAFVLINMFTLLLAEVMLEFTGMTPNQYMEDSMWNLVRSFVSFVDGGSTRIGQSSMGPSVQVGGLSIFFLICVVLMGSGLVSDDIRFKATEIYYSKLDKVEYIAAKYIAFILFGNLILTLPCIIEWGLLVSGIYGVDLFAVLPVLVEVIVFTEVIILAFGSIAIAISSLTNRRLYAGLVMFVGTFLVSMWIVPTLMGGQGGQNTYFIFLDIPSVLNAFSYMLAGETSAPIAFEGGTTVLLDLTALEGLLIIPAIIGYIALGLGIFAYQVMWRHSKQ
jgi:hypothetical protein